MRFAGAMAALVLAAAVPAAAQDAAHKPAHNPGLDAAARRYPPIITGVNTRPADGTPPLSCPAAGARVETKGGPTFEYLGTTDTPDLCRMRIGGEEVQAWYGIWLTSWPGADNAHPALKQVMSGHTGDAVGFDVRMSPGHAYHDLVRNEGIERIKILDATYQAMRLSHYREGFEGNTYRSVATAWKDMATGMILYSTYQHISGVPVIDDPVIPTAIVPAAR